DRIKMALPYDGRCDCSWYSWIAPCTYPTSCPGRESKRTPGIEWTIRAICIPPTVSIPYGPGAATAAFARLKGRGAWLALCTTNPANLPALRPGRGTEGGPRRIAYNYGPAFKRYRAWLVHQH